MKERWAIFILGFWLSGTIFVAVVATENFRTVDRLLTESRHPTFASLVEQLGRADARELLRHLSSELNRRYFQLWNLTQLAAGALVLWLIARVPSAAGVRWAVAAMVAIAGVMLVWLTPAITSIGRTLDFVPRDPPPPALGRFWTLHALYLALDACKLALGVIATVWIARGRVVGQAARSQPPARP